MRRKILKQFGLLQSCHAAVVAAERRGCVGCTAHPRALQQLSPAISTIPLAVPWTQSAGNLCVQWAVQIQSQHGHSEESPCLLPGALQCEAGAQNHYKSVTPPPVPMTCWGGSDQNPDTILSFPWWHNFFPPSITETAQEKSRNSFRQL